MSEYKLELDGMTCGACEKIIEKIIGRNGAAVNEIDANAGFVRFTSDEGALARIKNELSERGFREKGNEEGPRGNPERALAYIYSIIRADKSVEAEAILANYALVAAILSGAAILALYLLFLRGLPNSGAYAPLIALSVFAGTGSSFSYYHAKCYANGISCTNGMMVGMIMGMIPGYMAGLLIGATNGFFVGSLAGMAVGIFLGIKAGKCCGAMGAMEGLMAGLMAGVMGSMTAIMSLNDNVIALAYIIFGICGATLFGMSYLLHREIGGKDASGLKTSVVKFAATSVGFTLLLILVMFFGPKGPIVYQ